MFTKLILRVCGDCRYPPFEFLNDDGVFKGFNVDILKAIGKEVGVEIYFRAMPWSEAIRAVQEGIFDAIQGMALSARRQDIFDFTEAYLVVSHSVFVLRDRYDILTLNDLKGLKVAVQKDDISYDLINTHLGSAKTFLHYIFTADQGEALNELIEGKVDAFIGNRLTGTYLAQKMGHIDKIRLVGQPISPQAYAIAVSRGRKQLVEIFNKGLRAIKENGVYDRICEKWFGLVAEDLNSHIIDSVDVGVIGLNRMGIITSINSYARKILNIKSHNLIGKYALETELVHYFDFGIVYEAMATGKAFVDHEIEIKNGKQSLLSYNIFPLYGESNKVIGVVISLRDITLEKHLRENLARKDKMESLGMLLANIAHEIRNPIMAIKTFVEALPVQYGNPRFRAEMLKYVPMEIERLNKLVGELLQYAHPRAPVRKWCNLNEIVNSVMVLFQGQVNSGIDFEIQIDTFLKIWADEQQLKQILINLILNATEAIKEKGKVKIAAGKNEYGIWIEVEDDGCGISSEHLGHIFDPFYTTKEKGTGLGLFITYQLVKENHGDIRVFSQKGRGTRFKITFCQEVRHGENSDNR